MIDLQSGFKYLEKKEKVLPNGSLIYDFPNKNKIINNFAVVKVLIDGKIKDSKKIKL